MIDTIFRGRICEKQFSVFSGLFANFLQNTRLQVVSNFGDGDCGAGEIHTRAREISRRRDAKGAPKIRNFARVRVCISPAPQSPSPKLETTRSLAEYPAT